MATVVSTPVFAFAAAVIPGTAMGQSANLTALFNMTGAWEAAVPFVGVQPNTANISAGWEAYAYRSADGGTTYETVPTAFRSIVRAQATADRSDLVLPRGQWLLRIISGGGSASTFSFAITTCDITTAIANV